MSAPERLELVPVSFAEARNFVATHHRHHRPPPGHKFSTGVALGDRLVGVAIVGRPVARHLQDGRTLEVTRTATDSTPNANSKLLGAVRRAATALGYRRLITYTQHDESGSSLKAAGYRYVAHRAPRRGWDCPSRPRVNRGSDGIERILWEALL
ncbi:XF1762 family protein [Nocardia transvalensis]|uniref:XF1762 family protein n=1 Tax=Nocardia transvalensis TaxID=37333 RepID=UPI001894617D|nr:XF1762 family protein [Nocardia transvalensis]MBF6332377.1 hypothetical protein [Nocardia transvalensis]